MKTLIRHLLACALLLPIQAALALDTATFFQYGAISRTALSPGASQLAYSVETENDFELMLVDTQSGKHRELLRYGKLFDTQTATLTNISWVDDDYLLIAISQDMRPIADLADTKHKGDLFFIDTRKAVNAATDLITVRTGGLVVSTLPSKQRKFLYGKFGSSSRAYEIDVRKLQHYGAPRSKTQRPDGGQFNKDNLVAKIEGRILRFFLQNDTIVAASHVNRQGTFTLRTSDDGGKTWARSSVIKAPPAKGQEADDADNASPPFWPVAYNGDDNTYLAVQKLEGQPQALYKVDIASEEKTLLYQHPTSDIYDVSTSFDGRRLQSVLVSARGEQRYIYFDEQQKRLTEQLRKLGLKHYVSIVQSSQDQRYHTVFQHGVNHPGSYFLLDSKNARLRLIQHRYPALQDKLHSRFHTGQLQRDGLTIDYFLTLPAANSGKTFPLVVIPHGGPIGISDGRSYDTGNQLLSKRGYAVLQVNYRGSAGYGQAFMDAGKRQWGSGMLDDVKAAIDEVIARPDIAADRVCISGGSYGGYAALAMPARYPGVFKCSAAFAAVTDVQLHAARADVSERLQQWLTENIGDPLQDRATLRAISPVYQADKLALPLLLVHGVDDKVVDVEHYWRMQQALQNAGQRFESQLIDNMGHHLNKPEQAMAFYDLLLTFLDKHL